ncbi:unnamed protein product [Paramecium pentaurelia]|uniref:Uncharacterized protein n=1 Tax=Paramecium pentaurelia TaxID=43138 RepID=A0A8S1UHP0_9CILI|nr:unnamed protein product [Paramecium pentaurelia]CAD8163870.1 unnamed protein product [Paramecium pentaurelia]CAD8163874.1 unnamed protein product [Paramecium pentaurelia]
MKAFLLVCLIATSIMANEIDTPQEQELNAQPDSPSFLQLQACAVCCNGVCCATSGNCVKGKCNNIISPYCTQG